MVGQTTSYDVIANRKWYQLVDQTQGYLINVSLFRSVYLNKAKTLGGISSTPPLYRREFWARLYVRGLKRGLFKEQSFNMPRLDFFK